jgi:uncharacterized membrane protein YagU involved in acid resistance
MNGFQLEDFATSFALSLLASFLWILVCKSIPRLRHNLGACYGTAIALSWAPTLLPAGGPTIFSVSATLFCNAVICFAVLYLENAAEPAATAHDHI